VTIHFVYPHGPKISCPQAIGRNVAARLRGRYDVVQYEWDDTRSLRPGRDDVLLGHPHPVPWTIFRRSARRPGWKRVIMMLPFNHADLVQVAFADSFLHRCDLMLAITGNAWFETVDSSAFAHWRPKMVHVDLAVDRGDFPRVKSAFNPPGERRFLYIGHTRWYKNTGYLSEIAAAMPEAQISWIGSSDRGIPGVLPLGRKDFSTDEGRSAVAKHDFLLTVGSSDSNPTTILEAAAWGLVPVCTRESGYAGYPGIVNVPLGDAAGAVEVLRRLQQAPEDELVKMRAQNDRLLDEHFTWDRFAIQVVEAIESDASPALGREPLGRRLRLREAALRSPYSVLRPPHLRFGARSILGATALGRALLAKRRTRRLSETA
jgi:hypothetical protein